MIERINDEGYYLVQFEATFAVASWDQYAPLLEAASTQGCSSRGEDRWKDRIKPYVSLQGGY